MAVSTAAQSSPVAEFIPATALAEAVTRGLKSKSRADSLEPGSYPVRGEITVQVNCVVGKAEPVPVAQRIAVDHEKLLASILVRSIGLSLPDAKRTIAKFIENCIAPVGCDPEPVTMDSYSESVVAMRDHIRAVISSKCAEMQSRCAKINREGATMVNGEVKIVNFKPA